MLFLKIANENTTSNTNLAQQQQQTQANGDGNPNYAQMQTENLYDEYRKRLELIKNIKKVK